MTADSEARHRLARDLTRLAERTGDPRAKIAASVLVGAMPGRPAADDLAPMTLAASLFRSGLAKSRRAACIKAARLYCANATEANRMTRRLQRKLAQK